MSTLRYCANYSIPGRYFAGLNSSLEYIIRLRFLPLYRIRYYIRLYILNILFIFIFIIIFIIFVTVTCYLLVTVLLLAVLLQY